MGDLEYRKYFEIIFSCHSCGIEGSSFSIDDTRALFEQGLGYYPVGKSLLECQEMSDHFQAYEYLHPFRDGNGRTGRLLSNYLLLKNDLPELIIRKEDRQEYITALKAIRTKGTDEHLIAFFFQSACKQMNDEINQKRKGSRLMTFF